jgi:hypothetical protein
MPTSSKSRAEYWRAQAADAATAAILATDEPTKVLLLSIASVYESLAVKAETTDVAPAIQRTGTHNVG